MSKQDLAKALKYAAVASKIRCSVVEGMIPAVPYILRFKIDDYSYFIDYMRETIFSDLKASGQMSMYLDVASDIASDLGATEESVNDLPPPDNMSDEDIENQMYADLSVGQQGVDDTSVSNRTPYILSQYYGNQWPLSRQRVQMVTEEEGFWSKLRDVPLFKINGIAMSPDQALKEAIIALCLNLDAFANFPKKKNTIRPTKADVPGAFSFPSFPKLKEVDGGDVLDAIIVLECTMFINKVIALKEDPQDYDFPFNFANGLWKSMFPKKMNEWVIQQFSGLYPNKATEDAVTGAMRFPKRICYVPVLDHALKDDNTQTMGKRADLSSEILSNFPWKIASDANAASDNLLTPKEAKKLHPKINTAKAVTHVSGKPPLGASSNIPTISATVGKKISDHTHKYFDYETGLPVIDKTGNPWTSGHIEDKYNGGMIFSARRGGLLLQYFCKVDTELWERINVDENDKATLAETKGFRNLLYLYANRSHQLKGHINPHYWNKCMSAFFDRLNSDSKNLSSKTDSTLMDYTDEDLEKFRGRMGADYANVRMGIRLCWVVPSGMPAAGDSPEHPSGQYWYTKNEYGNKDLIKAYKKIKSSSKNSKMQEMFKLDKAHAYAIMHEMPAQYWDKPLEEENTIQEPLASETSKERIIPEYCFVFPLFEVLTDKPVPLNPNNWNIQKRDLSLKRGPNSTIDKLLGKMGEDPEFKILLDYIFPLNSIIPEIATIYGMEFFKSVGDYMKDTKKYFGGVKETCDNILGSFQQMNNPNHFAAIDMDPNLNDNK
tara:strand:+ start:362 stop:2689 length:2328 start_codon:yes stop_codon:yes gene_type:complete